jgi:riboflavin kinase
LNTVTFEGKVVSGEGNGKKYIQLPWVRYQFERKLGYVPFFGTLNIKLNKKSAWNKIELEPSKAYSIFPVEGYCVGLFFPANICGLECAILLPQVEGYSKYLLEVIAPLCLREALNLQDGDAVSVTVCI